MLDQGKSEGRHSYEDLENSTGERALP
jgi:hypothetical protein